MPIKESSFIIANLSKNWKIWLCLNSVECLNRVWKVHSQDFFHKNSKMSFEEVARMISNKISSYEQTMKQREALMKSMDRYLTDIKTLFQSIYSSIVAMKILSGSSVQSFPIVNCSWQLTKTDFQKRLEARSALLNCKVLWPSIFLQWKKCFAISFDTIQQEIWSWTK